jgi:DnaJ like chaperone protein
VQHRDHDLSGYGKIFGGFFGFMFGGGPIGALFGAALGHAADEGRFGFSFPHGFTQGLSGLKNAAPLAPLRLAAMLGQKEQVFSIAVIALSAKVARVDGPIKRSEIDTFKTLFKVPPEAARDVGRLFDAARDQPLDYAPYAKHLAESFADHEGVREDVLAALFTIARADGEANIAELDLLAGIATALRLGQAAWLRAKSGTRAARNSSDEDPYLVMGVSRSASDAELRAAWKNLMRENHPDSLASRGVPPEFIERAHAKVAAINAAWDRIKRERSL